LALFRVVPDLAAALPLRALAAVFDVAVALMAVVLAAADLVVTPSTVPSTRAAAVDLAVAVLPDLAGAALALPAPALLAPALPVAARVPLRLAEAAAVPRRPLPAAPARPRVERPVPAAPAPPSEFLRGRVGSSPLQPRQWILSWLSGMRSLPHTSHGSGSGR